VGPLKTLAKRAKFKDQYRRKGTGGERKGFRDNLFLRSEQLKKDGGRGGGQAPAFRKITGKKIGGERGGLPPATQKGQKNLQETGKTLLLPFEKVNLRPEIKWKGCFLKCHEKLQ